MIQDACGWNNWELTLIFFELVSGHGGGWLCPTRQPLLLEHQFNPPQLLSPVNLVKKLPVDPQVIFCPIQKIFERPNHLSAHSEIIGGATSGYTSFLKLKFGCLYILSVLRFEILGVHAHREQLISVPEDTLSTVLCAKVASIW